MRILFLFLLAVSFAGSAQAQSLESLEKVLARAQSLDDFLAQPELQAEYLKELKAYYHRDRFRCESYEKILENVRKLAQHVPGFKERVWEKLADAPIGFETLRAQDKLTRGAAEGTVRYVFRPIPRRFHGLFNDPSNTGCLSGNCAENDPSAPERWAITLNGAHLYLLERDGIFTDSSVALTPLWHKEKTFLVLSTTGGQTATRPLPVYDTVARTSEPKSPLEFWISQIKRANKNLPPIVSAKKLGGGALKVKKQKRLPTEMRMAAAQVYAGDALAGRIAAAVPRLCQVKGGVGGEGLALALGANQNETLSFSGVTGIPSFDTIATATANVTPAAQVLADLAAMSPEQGDTLVTKVLNRLSENPNPTNRAAAAEALATLSRLNQGPTGKIASANPAFRSNLLGTGIPQTTLKNAVFDPSPRVMLAAGQSLNSLPNLPAPSGFPFPASASRDLASSPLSNARPGETTATGRPNGGASAPPIGNQPKPPGKPGSGNGGPSDQPDRFAEISKLAQSENLVDRQRAGFMAARMAEDPKNYDGVIKKLAEFATNDQKYDEIGDVISAFVRRSDENAVALANAIRANPPDCQRKMKRRYGGIWLPVWTKLFAQLTPSPFIPNACAAEAENTDHSSRETGTPRSATSALGCETSASFLPGSQGIFNNNPEKGLQPRRIYAIRAKQVGMGTSWEPSDNPQDPCIVAPIDQDGKIMGELTAGSNVDRTMLTGEKAPGCFIYLGPKAGFVQHGCDKAHDEEVLIIRPAPNCPDLLRVHTEMFAKGSVAEALQGAKDDRNNVVDKYRDTETKDLPFFEKTGTQFTNMAADYFNGKCLSTERGLSVIAFLLGYNNEFLKDRPKPGEGDINCVELFPKSVQAAVNFEPKSKIDRCWTDEKVPNQEPSRMRKCIAIARACMLCQVSDKDCRDHLEENHLDWDTLNN